MTEETTQQSALHELFSRDPEHLTQPDYERMVRALTTFRRIWQNEKSAAEASGRKVSAKKLKETMPVDPDNITLDF